MTLSNKMRKGNPSFNELDSEIVECDRLSLTGNSKTSFGLPIILDENGVIRIDPRYTLPTEDPIDTGAIWTSGGTLFISTGVAP